MTARRIRVLHVVQSLNYGGMERVLADLVSHSDRSRFETYVLCLEYYGRFSHGLDASSLRLAKPMSRFSMLNPKGLASQIAEIAPDVVHTHSGVWHKASLAARKAGVPFIVHTEHGRRRPDHWTHRLIDGIAARRTDVAVTVSDLLAQELPEALWISRDRVECIRNGIDTETYRPLPDTGDLRRELGIPADAPIIGSIGRLEPIKDYGTMIAAFRRLRAASSFGGAALVICGEGTARPTLEKAIAEAGLQSSVYLLGWRDDIRNLHSAFSLFTMSSISEGTSISLLEAMSAGLPPVVTDVGGNGAVLGQGLASCLVPSSNPEALADGWARVLETGSTRNRIGALARERVEQAFRLSDMVRAYERVYERARLVG